MEKNRDSGNPRIVMLPWLAHGHVSPFLELAKNLSTRNFRIYFCSSTVILNALKHHLVPSHDEENEERPWYSSIELVDLHCPSLPSLPSHLHTTNALPPHLMPQLRRVFDLSVSNVSNVLRTVNPGLFIYDVNFSWSSVPKEDQGLFDRIPAVLFSSFSAATMSAAFHAITRPAATYPFPALLASILQAMQPRHPDFDTDQSQASQGLVHTINRSSDILLIKTFQEMEGEHIHLLSEMTKKKVVPVGTVVQDCDNGRSDDQLIQWLDEKEESTTVFVAFGSESFLTAEEMGEVAHGLELSGVNFMWVVRFPKGEEVAIHDALPRGFLERTKGRGLVVEGWAPQATILRHPSVGGFLSHCGWSSVMESMKIGVPIIAMPLQLDQPVNARVVEQMGVGLEIKRDEKGRYGRSEIGRGVRDLMAGKGGEGARMKAAELGGVLRRKDEEDIHRVARQLLHLCASSNIN